MKTILHFVKKEFLQFKRDPRMFGIILIAPVIQLVFLGYAAKFDVDVVHTAIFDHDKTVTSRSYIEKFESSGYFEIEEYVDTYDRFDELINDGDVILGLVIPNDFEKKINRNDPVKVQAIFDGSNGNTAGIAAGYVNAITIDFAQNITAEYLERIGMKHTMSGSVTPEVRVWYNPEMETRNFMVPGIVGLLLTIVTLMLTSLAIVKEKEIGTMEQLIVTPIKSYQIILGKLIPFIIMGFVVVLIVLNAMYFIFSIPIRGSIMFLYFGAFAYILSSLGLGLFISTISNTQQQAMMLAIFLMMMPMIFFSGFVFPIENMPLIIQAITYLVPLRYFNTILRGIILKGIGIAELWQEILLLITIGVTILYLSSKRFSKRLK
ncbi:ABC transporter permease [Bacteroidota bacterium]